MCSLTDAERHEKVAALFAAEDNPAKAREHFLEAASIYVLQTELSRNEQLLELANACYAKARELTGEKGIQTFSKQELAKRTLEELKEFQQGPYHHDILAELKIPIATSCGDF